MAKNYFAKFKNIDGDIYINPLQVTAVISYDKLNSKIITGTTNSEEMNNFGLMVWTSAEDTMKELTRALNAMFSELGQQLKDASIYDIQHRR